MINHVDEIDNYLKKLFPINRSIMGDGTKQTLKILQEIIPLKVIEYPTHQEVYDWIIPQEWSIKDAWIKNSAGEKIVDFKNSNLHIVSYSININKKMKLKELKENLHYLKNLPTAIPYRTSYYNKNWGFCISYEEYLEFFNEDDEYEVFIDSKFQDGSLSVGELLIGGKSTKEYLISSYICHPSQANDSLSGVILSAFLAKELLKIKDTLEYSYRIIFVPETIGAISYMSNNETEMKSIDNGLVITTCGGLGKFGYKQSYDKYNFINEMIESVFDVNNLDFISYPFDIRGSDERQYSTQSFRINCATITKDKYYEYDYYHTSLDNLKFVKADNLNKTLDLYVQLVHKMDKNILYKNIQPSGEVMLSKHDLYPVTGGSFLPCSDKSEVDIILWALFYLDASMDLFTFSKKIGVDILNVYRIVKKLEKKNILKRVELG